MRKSMRFLAWILMICTFSLCVTPGSATPPDLYRYGDADADNVITSTDARLILQSAVGKLDEKEGSGFAYLFDVDGDEKVTTTDARIVLQAAVGKHNYSCVGTLEKYSYTYDEEGEIASIKRIPPKLTWAYGVRPGRTE